MNEETKRRQAAAAAFTGVARHVATKDASFFRVKRRSGACPGAGELKRTHSRMEAQDGEAVDPGWPAKATELLADESAAKDLLYLAATSSDEDRDNAVINWFSARGMGWREAELAGTAFLEHGRDLSTLFFKLGEARTECGNLPEGFKRFFVACARAADRVVLPDTNYRSGKIDLVSFDRACLEAEAAIEAARANGHDIASETEAMRILQSLSSAGVEYRTNDSRQLRTRSLDGHMRRTAVKLWFDEGHVPPEGRYFEHVSSLVGFALSQAEFCGTVEGRRLGHVLRLEFCHAGRLAVRAKSESGPLMRAEEDSAKRVLSSVAEICKEIEDRGGCPGIVGSASVGLENECGMFVAASRLMAWQGDLDTIEAGAEYSGGEPVVGSERIEQETGRSFGELFDEEPDEFGATGGTEKRGSATVHTGRSRSFGDLFDD